MDPADLERMAIANLLAAYNVAGDRMRLADLAATFLEDGVLATPTAAWTGREEIERGLRGDPGAAGPRPTVVRHHLTTHHVEFTDVDAAQGRTYFMVFSDIGSDHAGHYLDRLRKTAQGWRFERRDVRVDWIAEASLFPTLRAAHMARRAAQAAAP
jgi:hypothetical protein